MDVREVGCTGKGIEDVGRVPADRSTRGQGRRGGGREEFRVIVEYEGAVCLPCTADVFTCRINFVTRSGCILDFLQWIGLGEQVNAITPANL